MGVQTLAHMERKTGALGNDNPFPEILMLHISFQGCNCQKYLSNYIFRGSCGYIQSKQIFSIQGGPLPVTSRAITPLIGVILPRTHL